jgi:hypothetical protein
VNKQFLRKFWVPELNNYWKVAVILLVLLDHGEYRKAVWFGKLLDSSLLFYFLFNLGCLASPISSQAFPMHIISAVNPSTNAEIQCIKYIVYVQRPRRVLLWCFVQIFGRNISDLSFLYRWLFIIAANTFRKVLPKHLAEKWNVKTSLYFRLMGS